MQHYELAYLISPNLTQNQAKELSHKILEDLHKEGAILDLAGDLVKINLAYPIKKHNEAYFGSIRFFLKKEKINKILNQLSTQKNFLRLMLTKKERPEKRITTQKLIFQEPKAKIKREKVELSEVEKKLDEIL